MEQKEVTKAMGILDKIGEFFHKHDVKLSKTDVALKVEFALSDGTNATVEAEDLEVNAKVEVMTAEGSHMIGDGEHVHEDGRIFTTKEGVVKEILTPEQIAEAAKVSDTEKDKTIADLKSRLKEKEEAEAVAMSKIEETSKEVEAIKVAFTSYKDDSKELFANLTELMKSIVDMPADKPSTAVKTPTKTLSKGELALQQWNAVKELAKTKKTKTVISN